MKQTRFTGYYSKRKESIHEGDGFMYRDGYYVHIDRNFKHPKYYDPNKIFGGAFYDKKKQEWWVTFLHNPELNIRLRDVEGVYQEGTIYRPE